MWQFKSSSGILRYFTSLYQRVSFCTFCLFLGCACFSHWSCFVIGATLYLRSTSTRLRSSQSLLHTHSILQRCGSQRQRPSVWSHELQQRGVWECYRRNECGYRQRHWSRLRFVIFTSSFLIVLLNPVKSIGCPTYLQVECSKFYIVPTGNMEVFLYGSRNKERLFFIQL